MNAFGTDTLASPAASSADSPTGREAAIAVVERGFDGPIPSRIRAVASEGRRRADQRAALAEARLYERQAADALRALCLRRRGPAGVAEPALPQFAAALTRSRHIAVERWMTAERLS